MNTTINLGPLGTEEAAALGGVIGALLVGVLVFYIFVIIGLWRIFEKAGIKGWKSLIPIYNIYCGFKIVGLSPWWFLWTILASLLQSVVLSIVLNSDSLVYWDNYYQNYIISESVVTNPWVILTSLLSFGVALYVGLRFDLRLARAFNKGTAFGLLMFFFPGIFTLILGFGSAKYDKKILKS